MVSLSEKAIKDAIWISIDQPSGPESHVMVLKLQILESRPDLRNQAFWWVLKKSNVERAFQMLYIDSRFKNHLSSLKHEWLRNLRNLRMLFKMFLGN